jgi:LacI family transcriptional regulator
VRACVPDLSAGHGPPDGLAAFLRDLPRPCGVLGANDYAARHVLLAAQAGGLAVPRDLAVLGVDDDALLCSTCTPPLASIAIDGKGMGAAAVDALALAMAGGQPPTRRLPPLGVIERQSLDLQAVADPDLARAWACIRARAFSGVGVATVAAAVPMSRSALDKRFRAAFGTTVGVELRRLRLAEARRLLADTDLPLSRIARLAGFASAKQFGAAFRIAEGLPPLAWRANRR